jgi:hypothetical protein
MGLAKWHCRLRRVLSRDRRPVCLIDSAASFSKGVESGDFGSHRLLDEWDQTLEEGQHVAEEVLYAEARLGELLSETVKPGNPQLSSRDDNCRLPEGVSLNMSSQCQKLARHPDIIERVAARAGERCASLWNDSQQGRLLHTGNAEYPNSACVLGESYHTPPVRYAAYYVYTPPPVSRSDSTISPGRVPWLAIA